MRGRWIAAAGLVWLGGCSLLTDLTGFSNGTGDGGEADGAVAPEAGSDGLASGDGSADAGADAACRSDDPSLVAWFPFDETSGTTAADCSQQRLVATSIGNVLPRWTTGRIGGALAVDGESCLDVAGGALFAFEGAPFTITAWVNVTTYSTSASTGRFIAAHKSKNGWHVGTDAPKRFELDLEYGDGGKLETSGTVQLATWTHVAAVYDPGVRRTAYVNGVPAQSFADAPAAFDALPTTPSLRIGCRSPGSNSFAGSIDELRIYSRVLTDGEIATLAQ